MVFFNSFMNILEWKEVIIINKKLPSVFKKDNIIKSNNKSISYVNNESIYDEVNVEDILDKLFNSSRYVFNIDVFIKTIDKEYNTRIIGRNKDTLLTKDNEEIRISNIKNIIIKGRI